VSKIKNGKMPLSTKSAVSSDFAGEDFNLLAIAPDLKAELDAKGLAYRFINAKQYVDKQGFHHSGWKVYKRDVSERAKGAFDFDMGTDPEGYVRRGDLILAVKPQEMQQRHKEKIRAKTARYSPDALNKAAAQQMRDRARENNVNMSVDEGYGSESGDDQD
jgi:hypothetical protein